ncbi:MAG: hypothetical protein ACI97A_000093 [Planctomycetota bacterium]
MTTTNAKTPPILYFLAILVVGAIWWFWSDLRIAPGERHRLWESTELDQNQIESQLRSKDVEQIGHALVQLKRVLLLPEKPSTEWLQTQSDRIEDLLPHVNPTVRRYAAYPLAYWPGDAVPQVTYLTTLLEDEDGLVSLNAAIALAARKNPAGADRLAEAIADTKGEQSAVRRSLLADFRFVAQERHREFLENELNRAQLDHDPERTRFCHEALASLDTK